MRSPVATGDALYTAGAEPTRPVGRILARSDKDGDGRLSIAESGKDGWLKGIANYYGNGDGFIVESEWLAANAAVVAPSSLVAVSPVRDAGGGTSARELWRYEKSFFGVVPSPLVLDGLVYTIRNGAILTILRADTGEVVKTVYVFFFGDFGVVSDDAAVALCAGKGRWARSPTREGAAASPIIAESLLILVLDQIERCRQRPIRRARGGERRPAVDAPWRGTDHGRQPGRHRRYRGGASAVTIPPGPPRRRADAPIYLHVNGQAMLAIMGPPPSCLERPIQWRPIRQSRVPGLPIPAPMAAQPDLKPVLDVRTGSPAIVAIAWKC